MLSQDRCFTSLRAGRLIKSSLYYIRLYDPEWCAGSFCHWSLLIAVCISSCDVLSRSDLHRISVVQGPQRGQMSSIPVSNGRDKYWIPRPCTSASTHVSSESAPSSSSLYMPRLPSILLCHGPFISVFFACPCFTLQSTVFHYPPNFPPLSVFLCFSVYWFAYTCNSQNRPLNYKK